jgi:putative membrane protein
MVVKPSRPRTFGEYFILVLKGFCMGSADVVPGVSGGTMAFILGIYQELIISIKSVDIKFFRFILSGRFNEALGHVSWKFLVSVAVGIFTAIFSIASLLSHLLHTYPIFVWSFFFGLVLASAATISLEIKKWKVRVMIGIIFGASGAFYVVGQVPVSTPETPWFLFMSGALAICAMILPGISGAFVLVLLGKYHFVLDAVNQRDFITLAIIASGAAVGLITFVRLLSWLFKKYQEMTIAILVGLMVGSLRKIWPWKKDLEGIGKDASEKLITSQVNIWPTQLDSEVLIALMFMILGFIVVILINYMAKIKNNSLFKIRNDGGPL